MTPDPNTQPTDQDTAAQGALDNNQDPSTNGIQFRSALKIQGGDQVLVEYVKTRMSEIRLEIGLSETNQVIPKTWMSRRKRNQEFYADDFSSRATLSTIFEKSNFTRGSGKRHARYISARVQDDLLGTDPFMGAMGRNPDDEDLAKQTEKFIQQKIDEGTLREDLRECQRNAIITDEQTCKIHWIRKESRFIGPATVYVGPDNKPILTPEQQLMVYEGDRFVPSTLVQGQIVLEKDPSLKAIPAQDGSDDMMVMIGQQSFEAKLMQFQDLPQTNVEFEGVKCEPLDFKAFLCPLRFDTIGEADACFHIYLESPSTLRQRWGKIDTGSDYFAWCDAPGSSQAKYDQGEFDWSPSIVNKMVYVAEGYVRHDFDGDGWDEEIFVLMDVRNGKLIFYDYLYNRMPRRPFVCIPGLERVQNRWYGVGIFTLTALHQLLQDAHLNRDNAKDAMAASFTGYHRDACPEWKNGERPRLGTTDIYALEPGYGKDKPPIIRINLDEQTELSEKIAETTSQDEDQIVGSISGRDASASDLEQSKTATGIVNLQAGSDAITKATATLHADAIEDILSLFVDLNLEHMHQAEIVQAGDDALVMLNAHAARRLRRNVRLFLTRAKSTQMQQIAQSAITIAQAYWQIYLSNPPMAKALRELFLNQLKGLEINDADNFLPEVTPEQEQQYAAQQAKGPQPPPPNIGINISGPIPKLPPQLQQIVAGIIAQAGGAAPPQAPEQQPMELGQGPDASILAAAQRNAPPAPSTNGHAQ